MSASLVQVSEAYDAASSLVAVALAIDSQHAASAAAHLSQLLASRAAPGRPLTPHARIDAVWPAAAAARRPLSAPYAPPLAALSHQSLAHRIAARRAAAVWESLRPAAQRSGLGVRGDQSRLAAELRTRMEQEVRAFAHVVAGAGSGGAGGRGPAVWLPVHGPEPDWDLVLSDAADEEAAARDPRASSSVRPSRAAATAAAAEGRFRRALAVRVGSLLTEVGPGGAAPCEWGWCLGAVPDTLVGLPGREGRVGPCPERGLAGLGRWMEAARVWGRASGGLEVEAHFAPLLAALRDRLRSDTLAGPPPGAPPPPPGEYIGVAAAATVRLLDAAAAAARGAARRDCAGGAACKAGRAAGLYASWAARQPRLYPYSRSLRSLCLAHSDSLRVLAALAALLAALPAPPARRSPPEGGSRPGTPAAGAAGTAGAEGWEAGWAVWAGRWRLEGVRGALAGGLALPPGGYGGRLQQRHLQRRRPQRGAHPPGY